MSGSHLAAHLTALGVLAVRGPDARRFLHGQLSQDVIGQDAARVALAGLHNPQGRVVALLRVVPAAPDLLLAVLPRELAGTVAARLARFVLRSKVAVNDESSLWAVVGFAGADADRRLREIGFAWPASPQIGDLARAASCFAWRHEDPTVERFVALLPRAGDAPIADDVIAGGATGAADGADSPDGPSTWRALDVAAGLPQVYAATTEVFVAQMLNLDVLGGISFSKGCYTGQEVIARAHYRGRVKRRLRRFLARQPFDAVPGARLQLGDGRSAVLVESAPPLGGRMEFLAVTGEPGPGEEPAADATPRPGLAGLPVLCEPLPLPYALPD